MRLKELDTPALLVDLDQLEVNISTMAALTKSQGINAATHQNQQASENR